MEWEKVQKWIAYLDKFVKKSQRNEQSESSQVLIRSGIIESVL